jgi:hypothetical protein
MYESEHAVKIISLGNRLQHEMANSYAPDRDTITTLCQEIENSAHLAERFSVSKSKAYNACVSLLLEGKVEEVRVGARTFYRVRRDEPKDGQRVED